MDQVARKSVFSFFRENEELGEKDKTSQELYFCKTLGQLFTQNSQLGKPPRQTVRLHMTLAQ